MWCEGPVVLGFRVVHLLPGTWYLVHLVRVVHLVHPMVLVRPHKSLQFVSTVISQVLRKFTFPIVVDSSFSTTAYGFRPTPRK